MKYKIMDQIYDVVVEIKRGNKNTYLRLKEPNIIYITTGYKAREHEIMRLLDQNQKALIRMHEAREIKREREEKFYYFGKNYDIIVVPTIEQIEMIETRIFTPSIERLEKWLLKEFRARAKNRVEYFYHLMEEEIPYPKIRIRKMKTRWGVCNKKDEVITLNSELVKYDPICLDYVIVHELSHFVHFNHSKEFWNVVSKYCSDYKKVRKLLKG